MSIYTEKLEEERKRREELKAEEKPEVTAKPEVSPEAEVSAGLREKVVRLIDPSGKVDFEEALRILLGYAEADALDGLIVEAEKRLNLADVWAEKDAVTVRLPRKLCEAIFLAARVEPKPENLLYALDMLLKTHSRLERDYSWLVDLVIREIPPYKVVVERLKGEEGKIKYCDLGKLVENLHGRQMQCSRYSRTVMEKGVCFPACIFKEVK